MIEKLSGIVLGLTRHTDRHNVVTLYTRSRGRLSFLSSAGGGRSGRLRNSRLQPLSVIEADVNVKQNAELLKLGSFALSHIWSGIYFHPLKGMVTLFLSEFLNRLLKAAQQDEALFDYIFGALSLFDRMEEGIADFHISFMASLLPFMGIQPDPTEWQEGCYFDMRNGVFSSTRPVHPDFVERDDALMMAELCRMDLDNVKEFAITNEKRQRLLRLLLHYYGIHYPGSDSLTSLSVLQSLRS
ncbi:MAG: DNA repair protein RecO C-terminal domain-containing protein [Muribaculaceae bacterium]|nr:DNA repair protein RecO C-terminal domain-containing protein [Muribaculaceae bacterium]